MPFLKRTWAEVDLSKIEENFHKIRSYVTKGCRVMAVVKADAYGHGAPYVAKTLEAAADMFGVSNLEEAIQLRQCGIEKPMLILGYTPPESAGELIRQRVTQTVFSPAYALKLSDEARKAGGKVKIHIKIDTGMSRIGFVCHGESDLSLCAEQAVAASNLPGLTAEGIFTHFAVADEPENPFTRVQFDRFMSVIGRIGELGVHFQIRHCCNSAGLLNDPEMHLDMVRPGIILYGMTPSVGMPLPIDLIPAMELKTVVFQVKELDADTPVSYGMIYKTPEKRVLGTLPIGYADGFPRSLSDREDVLVGGRRARIVGRVCMDQCMADVTGIPEVREGDVVTVIGRDGNERIAMEEIARNMGTINYETSCLIGKRVPRVFFRNGENVGLQNYFLP